MSKFKVDPETYGKEHGYPMNRDPFRNSRFGYRLDSDLKAGLRNAVTSGQTMLALEYLLLIVEVLDNEMPEPAPATVKPKATTKPKAEDKTDGEIAE